MDLCADIDEKDSVFVALILQLQGVLWTGDKKLVNGLRAKGFDLFLNKISWLVTWKWKFSGY